MKTLSKDITKIKNKPIWEVGDISREAIKNEIATNKDIEKMVIQAAYDGLNAVEVKYDKYGDEIDRVPDYSVRHKYWRDICIMKKWLDKSDLNIDARSLTINAQEEEILKRYSNGE